MHTMKNCQGKAMNLETPHGVQSKNDFETETSLCFSLVIVLMVEPSSEILKLSNRGYLLERKRHRTYYFALSTNYSGIPLIRSLLLHFLNCHVAIYGPNIKPTDTYVLCSHLICRHSAIFPHLTLCLNVAVVLMWRCKGECSWLCLSSPISGPSCGPAPKLIFKQLWFLPIA